MLFFSTINLKQDFDVLKCFGHNLVKNIVVKIKNL